MSSPGKGYIGNDCRLFLHTCGVLHAFVYDTCIICTVRHYSAVPSTFKHNYFEYIFISNMNQISFKHELCLGKIRFLT